ncbi:uncharacterized protein J3R85_005624 [Psidium guajava]|nr:uncharacterized protein J3R85_005624 [Psidium guajava]
MHIVITILLEGRKSKLNQIISISSLCARFMLTLHFC